MKKDALLMLLPLSLFVAGAIPLLYYVPPKGKKKDFWIDVMPFFLYLAVSILIAYFYLL